MWLTWSKSNLFILKKKIKQYYFDLKIKLIRIDQHAQNSITMDELQTYS
jgi:hypothetical protein